MAGNDNGTENITIGGETLDSWLERKEAEKYGKEKAQEIREKIEADKKALYSSPRIKHKEKPEDDGPVFQWPQSDINKMNIEGEILMAIEKKKSLAYLIIMVLATGTRHSCESIAKVITDKGRPTDGKQVSNPLVTIYRSQLGHFLERSGQTGKGYTYYMNRFGQEIPLETLYELYSKNYAVNAWNIIEKVPRLQEMGYSVPEGDPPAPVKKKRKSVTDEPKAPEPETPKKENVSLSSAIDEAVKLLETKDPNEKEVNLNINVRVSFSFSLD